MELRQFAAYGFLGGVAGGASVVLFSFFLFHSGISSLLGVESPVNIGPPDIYRPLFWGGLWGLLFGSAFFWIPGLGPLLVAGPLVSWIVGALEGAVLVGGLSAVGAGLYSLGIPKNSILQYETALKTGKFVLIAHGSLDETARAKEILGRTTPETLEHHQ